MRRAPTWEQLLASRQRVGYFSATGRARQTYKQLARTLASGGRTAGPERAHAEVSGFWGGLDLLPESQLEPIHQANPIEPSSGEHADASARDAA